MHYAPCSVIPGLLAFAVLRREADGFFLFLKAFSWETDLSITIGDYEKEEKTKQNKTKNKQTNKPANKKKQKQTKNKEGRKEERRKKGRKEGRKENLNYLKID